MTEEIYAPIINSEMTVTDALRQVCKIARGNNSLKRGFNEVAKSIVKENAKIILLSKEMIDNMSKIIIGLGKAHNIPIIKVENSIELGKIVGFEVIKDNEVVKSNKCGAAAITDFVLESEGRYYLENVLRGKNIE